jgi:hypothetical protein
MNSLSWLLYIASVVGSLSGFFAVLGMLLIIAGGMLCGLYAVETNKFPLKKLIAIPVTGLIFCLIACLIPSEKTIMYIAASEYGEKVVNSKEVQDLKNPALDLLKTWMKKESERIAKGTGAQ